ncbi:dihydrolipoyllysine-residue succinyltransferase [Mergibacter septicus]|uniref:Dihydrolipoyllysine-residue succinyltransferase component of 2-oxoglutarate dehydrogenase complex n=1 Tax=Mergibacter septicus TaxID=221402 RepID=A0A8E3S9V7_9PAST|nr:2-oxoglutarate dehydrogenase complex dihydrolipoyllysine-residue succinyltransferase [Mergibacter septicus]AWX15345.1 dihydrolipoyllysine-residue succinyltransferase [Mergibacter septicus]QDJ12822.1 dihydrolipoyllysine-residue succinyltransferase [Mergibacter septicus]QDJ14599.1 dihydrolipoyllysine-residue succinyltransferase [Mergibacter septicus]UTU47967.1 2-oxoglutarate dehydrogenase complex dihydrolipoyllysine-residue succinyltransferase [Mergibacter septicus]WMR96426.1 2-oxoglutarate d
MSLADTNVEILTPDLPESVADATVATWHKKVGDQVQRDELLVEIETDKVVLEVPAPIDGVLTEIKQDEGCSVVSKQLLGILSSAITPHTSPTVSPSEKAEEKQASGVSNEDPYGPAVRRLLAEHQLNSNDVKGSGKHGRISREDIKAHLAQQNITTMPIDMPELLANRSEKRVPMTRLRKRIAERLLEAKNNTAMLTTFNELDMSPIMALRKKYGEKFEKQHGVRLGFMSFYVKAVVEALKRYPEINASLDGDDVVYHNYFDISIAVSTPRGLVTPVLRDCDQLSMAEIEKQIKALAEKGRDGKLTVEDLTGGNFTITNGGVFGSLMSTPIINPPQSAILGMHAIKDRPVAIDGQVVIRPMMYLALSYDHRLVDGRESVGFLVTIKELLEDPTRILLEI